MSDLISKSNLVSQSNLVSHSNFDIWLWQLLKRINLNLILYWGNPSCYNVRGISLWQTINSNSSIVILVSQKISLSLFPVLRSDCIELDFKEISYLVWHLFNLMYRSRRYSWRSRRNKKGHIQYCYVSRPPNSDFKSFPLLKINWIVWLKLAITQVV